ncbi:hypothetical protein R1sor_008808 [Riccia sorocarpa]|uniref:Reverse transcriptase domain-containing protein n=1 Tax=Riccia sorocarpa TaxID=122646 RepID=A0ABD3HY14_9MARC
MPSKFFFSLLKAKRAREEITMLKTDDGRQLESEEDIMRELFAYYSRLFKQDTITEADRRLRMEVLTNTSKKLSREQNGTLNKQPEREEVRAILSSMPREKSPGLDGMTIETVEALGEQAENDVLPVALAFWNGEEITWKQKQRVIKLLPKEGDAHLIKNWRPISLLNLAYKEWCNKSKQKILFVKLDFEKAYDRVGHEYLWQTMEAMNISEKFIRLTRGLVEGATSKLHINGFFSKEIILERGVRQGCPLAPLLFAIATQPLMLILREKEAAGKLQGLKIKGQKSMLHTLFADDSGVMIGAEQQNFEELHDAVRIYERISGAKLNLKKSTVIPLGASETPDWLTQTGCHIAKRGEIVRYLGFPIGRGITEEEQKDYIVGKMKKKLSNWKFSALSFTGRAVALKHIIRSTPIHLIACLNLQKQSLVDMEAVCRCYLWGKNKDGANKISLIAWNEIQKGKHEGGLGMHDFIMTSKALRSKQMGKMFTANDEEWTWAAEQLIRSVKAKGKEARERRDWSIQEILILQSPSKVPAAPTASGLLNVWKTLRRKLELDQNSLMDAGMRTNKYLKLAESQSWLSREEKVTCQQMLHTTNCTTLSDWKRWSQQNNTGRDHIARRTGDKLNITSAEGEKIEDLDWKWRPKTKEYRGWNQPTKVWKALMREQSTSAHRFNKKWARNESDRKWGKRLRNVWRSPFPDSDKIWLWRVLQHGIPTLERIEMWGHGDGKCMRCHNAKETIDHLLIDCPESQKGWNEWKQQSGSDMRHLTGDFIDRLDVAWKHSSWAHAAILLKLIWNIWMDRNASTYNAQQRTTPIRVSVMQAVSMLEAIAGRPRSNVKTERKIRDSYEEIRRDFNLSAEQEVPCEVMDDARDKDRSTHEGGNARNAEIPSNSHEHGEGSDEANQNTNTDTIARRESG